MKNKNEDLFNSLFNKRKNKTSLRISFTENKKNNLGKDDNFKKSINSLILNINGEKPLIIYKKSPTKIRKTEIKINNYLSDGGIKKKNKKYFNLICNYSCKKESKNIILKEKNNCSQNIKAKKYKSFSFSNKKIQKNKNIFSDKENHLKNRNKSKGEIKYNLFLNNKNINSEEKEILDNISNKKISKIKTQQIIKKYNLLNNLTKVKKNNSLKDKNDIQKFIFMGKKLEYLKSHNIEISKDESNIEKEEDKNIVKASKYQKDKIKNITLMKYENNNKSNQNYKKQKPIVDQFEYIKKINTIHNQTSNTSKTIDIFKYYNLIKSENKNPPKSLNINTYKNNNKDEKKTDKNDDGYLFTNKKNYRNKEELIIFTKKKNSKEKKKKEKSETEKNKKIYKKFKNLYKLCLENINFQNRQNDRKTLNIKSQNNEQFRERRVKNNYYVGFDKTKNDSTFIEPKDYFLTLYQSKQLITNLNNEIKNDNDNNDNKMKEIKTKKYLSKNKEIKSFIKKLKNFIQKRTLVDLYFIYFKKKYYHHYFLSFKFFIAIMKQYAFKKIYFNNILKKEENNNKVIYLVEILSLILKIKVFENIYFYSQQKEIKIVKENLEKIIKIVRKFILYYFFKRIKNHKINKSDNFDRSNEINEEINDEINNELNENENIINNNLDNIYTEGLKNMIDEINNIDEENKTFKITNYDFQNNEIEIPSEDIPKNTKINYFNIIINNNINNVLNEIKENDFSDEKKINFGKLKEYQIDEKNEKENLRMNIINENKKNTKEFDELFGEIKQMKSYSECSGLNNESKSSKDNTINDKNKIKVKMNKTNKDINISLKKDIKVLNIIKGKEKKKAKEDIKIEYNQRNMKKIEQIIKGNNINNLVEKLTEDIIKMICETEITCKDKLLPKKQNNYVLYNDSLKSNQNTSTINNIQKNDGVSKVLKSLGIENKFIDNSKTLLDKSLIFSSSIYSIFNKTISEHKKELDENFFFEKILPKLIKIMKEKLIKKHKEIFNFIVTPVKIYTEDILVSINMINTKAIIQNYKNELFKENLDEIINKKELLNHFNKITNEIRKKYFIETEFLYDKILNDCLVDFLIETIKNLRLSYNLENNNLFLFEQNFQLLSPHKAILNDKNKFANFICKSMISLLLTRIGHKQNELNIVNEDKIREEKEIKLNNEIKKEIIDKDKEAINYFKIEEIKLKFEITENIFNLLLKETVDILEKVQNNRKYFYNNYNKSIYSNEGNDDNLDDKYDDYFGDPEDDIINY